MKMKHIAMGILAATLTTFSFASDDNSPAHSPANSDEVRIAQLQEEKVALTNKFKALVNSTVDAKELEKMAKIAAKLEAEANKFKRGANKNR